MTVTIKKWSVRLSCGK